MKLLLAFLLLFKLLFVDSQTQLNGGPLFPIYDKLSDAQKQQLNTILSSFSGLTKAEFQKQISDFVGTLGDELKV
jgi:hypothetical protein